MNEWMDSLRFYFYKSCLKLDLNQTHPQAHTLGLEKKRWGNISQEKADRKSNYDKTSDPVHRFNPALKGI